MNKRHVAFVVSIILCAGLSARGADEHSLPQVIGLCELVNNWKTYNEHEVRVRAIYSEEVVQERLYDPACSQAGQVAVNWPARLPKDIKRALRNLHRLITSESHKRAWVVVDGVFHGPEPFKESEIPGSLPPSMKEQMRSSHKRYGYMSCCDGLIEVTKLEEATKVDGDVPAFQNR